MHLIFGPQSQRTQMLPEQDEGQPMGSIPISQYSCPEHEMTLLPHPDEAAQL